jgi:hypothetical protein
MSNTFYLVTFSKDWADEFDVCGISVCDSVRLEHERAIVRDNADYVFSQIGFGSNEAFCEVTLEELFEAYTFTEISETTCSICLEFLSKA